MTTARYALEWARFADWCTATGRTPMPARSADVLAYLVDEQPTGGTAARWLAAIRATHRDASEADPCAGAPTVWVRRARAGNTTEPDVALAPVRHAVRALPTTGWPVGMFGRRDRLAFLLHRLGGLPARVLSALRVEDLLVPAAGELAVRVDGATTTVQAGIGDAELCPACAALSWSRVLAHGPTYSWRQLAARIAAARPVSGHLCAGARPGSPGPAGWPLFPAVNRWGHLPAPPAPAMSGRALAETLRRVDRGISTHVVVPLRTSVSGEDCSPVLPAPPSAPPRPLGNSWHREGLLARRQAHESLADVSDRMDELFAAIEDWESRVATVMQAVETRANGGLPE